MKKTGKKQKPGMTVCKIIMLALTAVYPALMVTLSGAGLVYNRESYGSELAVTGVLLILSGVMMTAGALLCLSRKNLPNIFSLICTVPGLAICLVMLHKLAVHADSAGWSDKFTMSPISDMYRSRILPSIAPAALAVIIAVIQLLSYEAAEQRRIRRERKREAENAPAPSIFDEE